MKDIKLFALVICVFFLAIGSTFAADVKYVSDIDNSSSIKDNNQSILSSNDLRVSNNDSISETNSHNVNLNNNLGMENTNQTKDSSNQIEDSSNVLKSNNTGTILIGENITMFYKDGTTRFSVKLTDSLNNPLSNMDVTFIIVGQHYVD